MMNIIQLFLVVTVSVLMSGNASNAQVVKGEVTVSGVTCKYFEVKKSGSGPRGIRICGCKNNQGKTINKSCVYYGANPHNCGNAYNNRQPAYYLALARSALENGAPCAKPSISETICDLTYPCTQGDCLGSRRRRDVASGTCPSFDLGSSNAPTITKGFSFIVVSLLTMFVQYNKF